MNAPTESHRNRAATPGPAGGSTDRWIERTRSRAAPRFRLFCFPYAGGSAAIFREWADELALNVEVCAIRLPGRERRFSEPALRRAEDVVESLIPILQHLLDMPFVMFGYSMGALLAYEVARAILTTSAVEPRALFASAHRAPHLPMRRRNWYDLPRDELIAEVKALNGTPAEVFQHDDLVELVLPMLRSDLELVETYKSPAGPVLSCPVIAMGGSDDRDVSPEELAGWASATTGPFKSMMFDGDHFFINSARTSFLHAVRRELGMLGLE
jgi:medium-chain acyl-[acyl-carrier-protein] hydrolase